MLEESMLLRKEPSPFSSPSHSFSYAPSETCPSEFVLSPMSTTLEESLNIEGNCSERKSESILSRNRSENLVVWRGHKAHSKEDNHHKTRQTPHRAENYRRTCLGSEPDSSGRDISHKRKEKTEFVVTTGDTADLVLSESSTPVDALTKRKETKDCEIQPSFVPVGVYLHRDVVVLSNMSIPSNLFAKSFSCSNHLLIFSPHYKAVISGMSLKWSDEYSGLLSRQRKQLLTSSSSGFTTPSRGRGDVDIENVDSYSSTAPPSKGSKNIFMNRKTEVYARLGERSRQTEIEAGRLRGEASGINVATTWPLPPYLGGIRGQILLWGHVNARYVVGNVFFALQ